MRLTVDPDTFVMFICLMYAAGLVSDYLYSRMGPQRDPARYRTIRWAMIVSYLVPAIPLLYFAADVLPPAAILVPSLGGAAISFYIHVIRFRVAAADQNPYRQAEL